jgi:hypothetical protein
MNAVSLPPISSGELLARFITVDKWVRADRTVRQDAFIPPRDLQLSVTRHVNLAEAELWNIGQRVADQVAKIPKAPLYGRADLRVAQVAAQNLNTDPAPLADNPNHAHITGWPTEKPAQKLIAQELAAAAVFRPR